MARPLRIEYEGALHHVMSRGNERRRIVRDDADRKRRLEWLERTVETYGWRLHAFCLMDNHEHLFVETPAANLSAGMQFLNGSYTSYFNLRHRRSGHLFQGRFKSLLVEEVNYFDEISRYIHLNPCRAGLAKLPEDYRWSSYRGYHRATSALAWVTYARVLREFGRDAGVARRRYRRYVLAGLDEKLDSPWDRAVHGLVLGSDKFVSKVQALVADRPADASLPQLKRMRDRPSLARIVQSTATYFGHDVACWRRGGRVDDVSRALAAYLARVRYGYSATAAAAALGYASASSVTHAVKRVERRLSAHSKPLRQLGRELQ